MQRTQLPAVSLCAGCAAGVLLAFALKPAEAWWMAASVVAVAVGIALVMMERSHDARSKPSFRYISVMRSAVYWCAALCCGGWMGIFTASTRINVPSSVRYGFVSDMQAVVRGEVMEVLRRDSTQIRCIVAGSIDTKPLPRLFQQRITLTIVLPRSSSRTTSRTTSHTTSYTEFRNAQLDDIVVGVSIYAPCRARLPRSPMLATDFNEAQYLASLDVQWLAIAMLPHVAITEARTNLASQTVRLVQIAAAQTSRAIRERVCMMFPSSTEGFALALLTGDRSLLPASTQHEYALAGTAHVLAVSGLHIGLLAVIMLVPLAWLPSRHSTWNAWLKTLLFSVSIAAFVLLTGASPSSVRAGVMAVLLVVVRVMQREAHLLNVVAFTVVIMLAVQPAWMLSVSFQLSVLALVGIAALYPMMNDGFAWLFGAHKRAFMRLVAASLAVTLASSVVVAPLVAWYFGVFSFVAPVANLLVVPASSAAMLYTLAAVLMSWLPLVGWPVATLFASAAHGLLWVMDVCNHLAASAPLAFVEGVWALPAAVLCSASVVYVLSAFAHADRVDGTGAHPAFTARLLVFRLLVAAVAVALCIVLWRPFVSVSPTNLIIARPQVVAAILPCTTHDASNGLTGRTVIVLQDRRFDPALDATPRRDAGLEQYVVQYVVQYLREHAHAGEGKVNQDGAAPDSLLLCVTGPCSIWLASRIAAQVDEELSKKASERVSVSVLATSLQYKQARMFSALDSLDARRVRVVNAQEFLRRDSILAISTLTGRVAWHPWRAVLVMPSGKRVVLPNYINTDTDTDISKDIHKDIHNDIRIYADVAGDAQKP